MEILLFKLVSHTPFNNGVLLTTPRSFADRDMVMRYTGEGVGHRIMQVHDDAAPVLDNQVDTLSEPESDSERSGEGSGLPGQDHGEW